MLGATKPLQFIATSHLEPVLSNKRKPLQGEACTLLLESSPHSPHLEKSLHTAIKTQGSQKISK